MKLYAPLLFAAAALAMVNPSKFVERSLSPSSKNQRLAQNAKTQFVNVNNTRLAYRRFGKRSKIPLLYLTHFRGSMDVLDPALVNAVAQNREVILVDNSGIGHSEGTVPDSIQAMAAETANFLAAINVPKADILGFSMGGMVAQYIAMEYPQVLNKLVLAGVRPGYGPGVVSTPANATTGPGGEANSQPTEDYMLGIFFFPSESSRSKGNLWWKRIMERRVKGEERKDFLVGAGVGAQLTAITSFASDPRLYARLSNITGSVLVTSGKDDLLMGTANTYVLQQQLSDAELLVYPDSAHGHLFQFPLAYADQLELFLD